MIARDMAREGYSTQAIHQTLTASPNLMIRKRGHGLLEQNHYGCPKGLVLLFPAPSPQGTRFQLICFFDSADPNLQLRGGALC